MGVNMKRSEKEIFQHHSVKLIVSYHKWKKMEIRTKNEKKHDTKTVFITLTDNVRQNYFLQHTLKRKTKYFNRI